MARETLESLRVRLLSEHSVQTMIRMRAYEIYQMRGGQPGGEAQDWFHAEGEVLAYLIANESEHGDEPSEDQRVDELVDQAFAQSIYESIEDALENTIVSETADSIIPEEKPTAKKPRSGATKSSTSKAAAPKKQVTTKKSTKSKSKSETVRKKSKTQPAEKDTAS
jgi:hypothetical protein